MSNLLNQQNRLFHVDSRQGSLNDSINGLVPTVYDGTKWSNFDYSYGVGGQYGGFRGLLYNITSIGTLPSSGTVFLLGKVRKSAKGVFIEAFIVGNGLNIYFDANKAFGSYQYDGGAGHLASTYLVTDEKTHVFAIRYEDNVRSAFFVDGNYVGEQVVNYGTNDTNLRIGHGPDGGYSGGTDIKLLSICSAQLSNEIISKISVELLKERGAGDPKTSNFKWLNNPINNEFTKDANWTKGTGWTIANGKATSDGTQTGFSDLYQADILRTGLLYTIEYKVSGRSAGSVAVVAGETNGTAVSVDGVYTERLRCGSGFAPLAQTTRNWRGITTGLNGDVYACVFGGDIYKQTGGVGDFIALSQTTRDWMCMTTGLNGDIYAGVYNGDIYKQTAGTGDFVALSQTTRNWRGMTTGLTGDVYNCLYSGDIYKQTAGTGDFVALSQSSRAWRGMTTGLTGDVYACVFGGDIYKQTGGVGDFIALSQTTRDWMCMTTGLNGDIYAGVYNGDIYKQTAGTGVFVALSQSSRAWYGMTTGLNGDIYVCTYLGDIYKFESDGSNTKIVLRANLDFVGSIDYVKVHAGTKLLYTSDSKKWLPTLANVTAGRISNTDFRVSTGAWKVSEDSSKKKWIENVTAGMAYMPSKQAYGTWVFEVMKGADANAPLVHFVSTNMAGATGYRLVYSATESLAIVQTGTGATVMATANSYLATSAITYKIAISRNSAGAFTMYIKGGTFTDWTIVSVTGGSGTNPATNNNVTTSSHIVPDLDAGDKFNLLGTHLGVLDISELTALY